MDYYGLLFLYYLKGLSGKAVLRLFFNIEAGGTEQLLPENTSTPTTTPILADIQYPDGLRTDQYFTYRETPTTVSNKARIKTIKGNTLRWSQLVQNGNFNDTTYWIASNVTFSVANNTATVTRELESTSQQGIRQQLNSLIVNGNKYLISFEAKSSVQDAPLQIAISDSVALTQPLNYALSTSMATYQQVFTAGSFDVSATKSLYARTYINQTFQIKNIMLIDLSAMFGVGNEPSTAEEFTSLFSLPYYDFNQGSLLSFNGNGIKTVGFNQWDEEWEVGGYNVNGEKIADNTRIRSKNLVPLISGLTYYFKSPTVVGVRFFDKNKVFIGTSYNIANDNFLFTVPSNASYLCFSVTNTTSYGNNICINISSSKNGTYEPYTSSTTNLTISTYFPTGMKSAGSVYDELTESKAITRVGSVDLGSIAWALRDNAYWQTQSDIIPNAKKPSDNIQPINAIHSVYEVKGGYYVQGANQIGMTTTGVLNCNNGSTTDKPSGYLYYELATPTETPITTEDANEALSLLMGKSVSSSNANQLINIITKGE